MLVEGGKEPERVPVQQPSEGGAAPFKAFGVGAGIGWNVSLPGFRICERLQSGPVMWQDIRCLPAEWKW